MLSLVFGLSTTIANPLDRPNIPDGSSSRNRSEQAQAPGQLQLGPGLSGSYEIVDKHGVRQAKIEISREQQSVLVLPPGEFLLRKTGAESLDQRRLSLRSNQRLVLENRANVSEQVPSSTEFESNSDRVQPRTQQNQLRSTNPNPARQSTWKRIVAPLASATLPGLGQMLNRQILKGSAILSANVGLVGAAFALSKHSHRDNRIPFGRQAARLSGLGLVTGTLQLLYAVQILDAYRVASPNSEIVPIKQRLRLDLIRMLTIGLGSTSSSADYFPDWNTSVLVSLGKRRLFSLGLSDLGIKFDPNRRRSTIQMGMRGEVQIVQWDRLRLRLNAAVGSIIQTTRSQIDKYGQIRTIRGELRAGGLGFTPYAQLDFRYFALDRWAIMLVPRLSVPLQTRYYALRRAIPRYAATFELGTGVGAYF